MSSNVRTTARAAWPRVLVLLLAALLLATSAPASAAPGRAAPPPHASSGAAPPPHAQTDRELTVMTRNLYLGAELGPIFAATSAEALVGAVSATYAAALASDFPGRAELLADEIVAAGPHLVGLQEVSLWRTGAPGTTAETVVQDFLQILLDALEARGASYEAVSVTTAFDGQLPAFDPATGLFEARLTDRDVILARTDLPISRLRVLSSDGGLFDAALELPVLGQPLRVERGWTSVDVKVRGKVVRFVNTHFEAFDPGEVVRVAQAQELLAGPLATPLLVVLVGDINSDAEGDGLAYGVLHSAGFADAWSAAPAGADGLTCCHTADLLDPTLASFRSRIDVILTRGPLDVLDVARVGVHVDRRTPEGRWPSDHAGVVADLRLRVR